MPLFSLHQRDLSSSQNYRITESLSLERLLRSSRTTITPCLGPCPSHITSQTKYASIYSLPIHLYNRKKITCPSLLCSCLTKQVVDLEGCAFEGNATWVTIWQIHFLTFFLGPHLSLWFSSSHFSISVQQKNLGQFSQQCILFTLPVAWTILLTFLWTGEILADMELLLDQSKEVQGKKRNPQLRFSFVNKHMQ